MRDGGPGAAHVLVSFVVDDVRASGGRAPVVGHGAVVFDEYDTPGMKTEDGDRARSVGAPAPAWLKDPDGNILEIVGA